MRHSFRLSLLSLLLLISVSICALAAADDSLRIADGTLLPMLTYSDATMLNYTNDDSDILRFVVYVETDHDTDADGKPDLVKTFLEVPRAAAEGKFKAATILDPTPYNAGTADHAMNYPTFMYNEAPFDYRKLYITGTKRVPAATTDTLTLAENADPADWIYTIPRSAEENCLHNDVYNYYLVRGYAVAYASGIGTYGSEGYELCGMDLERDAMKNVVEWLAGDRVAYTDRNSNIAIYADWSNGNVAMTGTSYGGTLPYEVATTGVKGLKTIIPFSGIANWYEYTNSQGVSTRTYIHYTDFLAINNAGATYLDDDWTVPNEDFGSLLWQIMKDQEDSNGDYSPAWAKLDYSGDWEKINCSALIVQGLNDYNVTTRQADLMMQAFANAGKTAKLVLHQDGHSDLYAMRFGDTSWYEFENRWLAHYLYNVDNEVESIPTVLFQSNLDGNYYSTDTWREFHYQTFPVYNNASVSFISTDGLGEFATQYLDQENSDETIDLNAFRENYFFSLEGSLAAFYSIVVPDNTTIFGVPEIHLRARTDTIDKDGLMITAALIDVEDNGKPFKAYNLSRVLQEHVATRKSATVEVGGNLPDEKIRDLVQSSTTAKEVSYGWTDLCNPGLGIDHTQYTASVDLEKNTYYDYTFYMMPTVYTVAPGHYLCLVLTTWDGNRCFLDEDYQLDPSKGNQHTEYDYEYYVDNNSILARIPVL